MQIQKCLDIYPNHLSFHEQISAKYSAGFDLTVHRGHLPKSNNRLHVIIDIYNYT